MYFRDPNRYVTNAGFVAKLGVPLLELLAPESGLRVLDLGCGEGALERRGIDAEGANPWYFGHPDEYRRRLETQGFDVPFMAHFSRPTPLPGDMKAWLQTFAESYLGRLPASKRETYLAEVQGELGSQLQAADGTWIADYVRLRFLAHKR